MRLKKKVRYMVKTRNKPLRQIVIKIRLHRGGTRWDFIENCPHRLGIADVNHVPITFIKFHPNVFHVESYYRCYIVLFNENMYVNKKIKKVHQKCAHQ